MSLGKWASAVHAHYLDKGQQFTALDAVDKFGNPAGGTSAARALNYAVVLRCFEHDDGPPDRRIYRAVELPKAHRDVSYFEGLKRVRSVFELGDEP